MTTTPTDLTAGGRHTYHLAERLRGIAIDKLYTFTPGHQQLNIDTLPEDLDVLARFSTHNWGISAQLWARDEHGTLQASAEASAGHLDTVSPISARIKNFRSGALLWTHIGTPISAAPISALGGAIYTTVGRHCYQLTAVPRLGAPAIWQLHTDDLDVEHPQFAGVDSATTHIAEFLERTPTSGRRRTERRTR